eukprot:6184339-Pleurochrysis_carterae.AAC.2
MAPPSSSQSKHSASFGLVMGGKLKLKGEKKKEGKRKRRAEVTEGSDADAAGADDEELQMMSSISSDPVPGSGKLATSGVVVMGLDTDFTKEITVGDTLLVTVVDKYRNTEAQESRVVNMVLGKSALYQLWTHRIGVVVATAGVQKAERACMHVLLHKEVLRLLLSACCNVHAFACRHTCAGSIRASFCASARRAFLNGLISHARISASMSP